LTLVVHADWSVNPRGRWMCAAKKTSTGWGMNAPVEVGALDTLFPRLRAAADGAPVLFGMDCPAGLPAGYAAQLTGYKNFPDFLRRLPADAPFYSPACALDEVSLARPFYPRGTMKGAGQVERLAAALKLPRAALLRRADRRTPYRPDAAAMFWTLGPKQCGKAALTAWRELLGPALRAGEIRLWPFDGTLDALLVPGALVVAETYPAECLRQVGLTLAGSKRAQAARQALAPALRRVMGALGIAPSIALRSALTEGFGPAPSGEDPFDSVIGALGMLKLMIEGGPPVPAEVTAWEGWMLGLEALSAAP